MEAFNNYIACLFQVRLWDWSGLLLQCVCNKVNFFVTVTTDGFDWKNLLEKYIDEILTVNRQRMMQGEPPAAYV